MRVTLKLPPGGSHSLAIPWRFTRGTRAARLAATVALGLAVAAFPSHPASASQVTAAKAGGTSATAPYDFAHAAVPPTSAQLQAGINDVLRRTPGARQINANTIEMAPGFYVGLPAAAPAGSRTANAVSPRATCSSGYLCVWTDAAYGGTFAYFQTCGYEWDLGKSAFPGGGYWNDRISSISNPQTTGIVSYFYNWTGSYWSQLLTVPAGTHRRNLALDSSDDGSGSPNDRIDGMHVCGSVPDPWQPNHWAADPP